MDPNLLFTFGIPAAVIASMVWRRLRPTLARPEAAAAEPITAQIAQATPSAPLAARSWFDYVNRQPDQVPHLAVIGPSGAGKTTVATAVLGERPGQIAVITAKEGDDWGGLPYVGIDEDATYTTADRTFAALGTEVKRRLVAVKQRRMTADWLTVVLDDYSALRAVCPAADEPFKLIARLGRSLRVRLLLLSDSALVKALGLEGEGETRGNFAFIRLARGHKGTIEIDGAELPIDISMVRHLATRARLSDRAWHPPRDPNDELADYLGLSADERSLLGSADQTDQARPDQTAPSERSLLRKYRAAGLSREQARQLMQTDGYGFDNNVWAEVGKEIAASA